MIERLRGTIIAKQAPEVIIDVGGVGYEVRVPMTTIYQLPGVGEGIDFVDTFLWSGKTRNNFMALFERSIVACSET